MKGWRKCLLGDIITFQRGYDLPKSKMVPGKYPVIGSNGVIGFHNEYTTEAPSITIGRSGNTGNPFIVYGRSWSHNTTLYVKEFKGSDPIFIYYLLKHLNLGSFSGGSAVPTLNRNHIHTLEVFVPPLVEQIKIGRILRIIDDKIATNNAINQHLEQIAKAIFKSWFVDFEPFGGEMPSDWREGTLSDICTYSSDRVLVSSLSLDTYISTENMVADRGGYVTAKSLPTVSQTTGFTIGDTLISNIRPYFKKIVYCDFSGGCSTDVLCFRPIKDNLSLFVYYSLYSDDFFDYMVAGSKGTKMPRGDKQQIMNYRVVIPADSVVKKFTNLVLPMVKAKSNLNEESTRLATLRDTLLPRLMSGELSVADLKDIT